jgi:hypothetical protein
MVGMRALAMRGSPEEGVVVGDGAEGAPHLGLGRRWRSPGGGGEWEWRHLRRSQPDGVGIVGGCAEDVELEGVVARELSEREILRLEGALIFMKVMNKL